MKDFIENDKIVISGVSGKFPQCANIEEFQEALLNNEDLITENDSRYPEGIWGLPKRSGVVLDIDKFDTGFFGIHPKQANFTDPRHRILFETAYESIIDAGYNPVELRGANIGVYVGICNMNSQSEFREQKNTCGYTNIGVNLCIAANRISYCFDFKGPSFAMDTACSSSSYAFVNAIKDLMLGEVDGAIVCGTHLIQHPFDTLEFLRLSMLSPEGKCKVFATNRDGYARAESVVSYFIQRESKSRRVYATVLGAKCSADGFKKEGITYPSMEEQYLLMKNLYSSANVDPNTVQYVEAHGTGTPIGDIVECESLRKAFCQNRKEPLLIGSVKSNMGHAEIASGVCCLAKAIITINTGIIPANIHVDNIDTSLPGIGENQLKIVTKNTKFNGGIIGINGFGFGGTNTHIILDSNKKEKAALAYKRAKKRLVQVSGRTEEAVLHFLDGVEKNKDDPEFLALIDQIHKYNIEGHSYRGYSVLGDRPMKQVERCKEKRPIWFVYTGMGSQWNKMGRDLMNIPVFRNTINRCAKVLEPHGIDLINIITSDDPAIFDNVINCFASIGCIEIALTDLLYSLNIYPDGICGHSLGEVGAGYADGGISAEQATLLAYARGYCSRNCNSSPYEMAAIGLSKETVSELLPDGVYISCQNSKSSITIGGPRDAVKDFVEKLSARGIFAKLVKSGGIAYHTQYIREAGNSFLEFCKNVLPHPKPRSPKWVSSSVPESKQHEKWAQLNCAEYHHYNFCNTVIFDQVYSHIPSNAIVIEVAPHGLLQPILKKEMGPETTQIAITNRSSEDNEKFFLSALGRIFIAGGQPNLTKLYNEVTFPVSRGTKMISPLVKWDHSISWYCGSYIHRDSFGKTVEVSLSDEKYAYIEGHQIDGRILMPATGYLDLIWEVMAEFYLKSKEELPIIMENIKFKRATIVTDGDGVAFTINIMKQSGYFEILEGGAVVCLGYVRIPKNISLEFKEKAVPSLSNSKELVLKQDEIYQECRLRRYMYKNYFRGLSECDLNGRIGKVEWKDNFGSFFDTMLHITLIEMHSRDSLLPTGIRQITIYPIKHLQMVQKNKEDLPISYNTSQNLIKCGGVEIIGTEYSKVPRRQNLQEPPYCESYDLVNYMGSNKNEYDLETATSIAVQIILQNYTGIIKQISICEIISSESSETISSIIKNIMAKPVLSKIELTSTQLNNLKGQYDVIIIGETELGCEELETLTDNLTKDGFIIFKGHSDNFKHDCLDVIFMSVFDDDDFYLLKPVSEISNNYTILNVSNNNFEWLENLKNLGKTNETKTVYLVSENEDASGIIGLTKCLLTEPTNLRFSAFLIDQKADKFSVDDRFYRKQIEKNLTLNILKNNKWATYVHLPLKELNKHHVGNAAIGLSTLGDLSTISWMEKPFTGIRIFDEAELVYIYYSALNFKDVMNATGKLPIQGINGIPGTDSGIGFEYSGVTAKGKRIMGMVNSDGLSLQVYNDPNFTWEVPKDWSLREACTIPCVYATCYYGLIMRGQMQPGESILIHAGTGGIGIAAINIALSMGCEVYTTVSTKEKRDYLKSMFPAIKDKNIGNSRDTSFEIMIKENTNGRGVDLVLNSLADALFQASIRCLAQGGRFIEIGKVDLMNSSPIPTNMFLKNICFHGVHLDNLFYPDSKDKCQIQKLVAKGIVDGVVKPLPTILFKENDVESAFRFLASGKHKGKVVVEIRDEDLYPITKPIRTILATPKVCFDSDKSFILIGGLGGFGLELTGWLIEKGVTRIIINSRRNMLSGLEAYYVKKWSNYKNIIVKINTSDTSTEKGAEDLIRFAEQLGPVGGIFNLALVLRDQLFINQTKEQYREVFKPKIVSLKNMDKCSRKLCPDLKYFVAFSSVATGRGNSGQTNYGMANSAMEMLCEKRRRENLPGMAIQWGPIGEVGALQKMGIEEKLLLGLVPQNIDSCLNALERFLVDTHVILSSVVPTEKNSLSKATSKSPVEAVAHILGIKNLDTIDKSVTLSQLGLDSLMVTEIKQTLYRNFNIDLSPEDIRELTLNKLTDTNADDKKEVSFGLQLETDTYILSSDPVLKLNSCSQTNKKIFLIHPIEGHVNILKPLGSRLNATVYGLQCTNDNVVASMSDFGKYFVKKIKEIQPKGPYYLCGYSYGCTLGSEMGIQLEDSGEQVDIVHIDGSPSVVHEVLKVTHMSRGSSVEKSKENILEKFCNSFPQVEISEVQKCLSTEESFDEKLKSASELVSKATGIDRLKVLTSANSFIQRIVAGFFYKPSKKLSGRIMLIRRNENPFSSEDYDLSKVCKHAPVIETIDGNHRTILLGKNTQKVADLINKFYEV